jgi:hypothetical protein
MRIHFLLLLLPLLAGTILLQYATVVNMAAANTLYKYNISGTLYCSENGVNTPIKDRNILLKEMDGAIDGDDLLGQTVTDENGYFEGLVGVEDEGDEPEVFLAIQDGCDHWWTGKNLRLTSKTI